MKFTVTTEGRQTLGLRKICQDFASGLWVPAHYTQDQAAEFVLDQFRRSMVAEMEMLEIHAEVGVG